MKTETELKFEINPSHIRRLRRHPFLRSHKTQQGRTQFLKSIYYDTPDTRLMKEGISLRIRHSGKNHIQTVKIPKEQNAGTPLVRSEWERPVPDDQLDTALLIESGVVKHLGHTRHLAALTPLFTVGTRRTTYLLKNESWLIELSIDTGTITPFGTENRTRIPESSFTEIELELIEGDWTALYHLAETLGKDIPLRLSPLSKSSRGYRLLEQDSPQPIKASDSPLDAMMTTPQGFQTLIRTHFGHFLHNLDVLRKTHCPEAIHQTRVALRRLRSLLFLFRPLAKTPEGLFLHQEIRWLASELGEARNLDVFLDKVIAPITHTLPDTPSPLSTGLKTLSTVFDQRRNQEYTRACTAVNSHRCDSLVLSLSRWILCGDWRNSSDFHAFATTRLTPFATKTLSSLKKKALKRGKGFSTLPPEQRHRVRIEIKKLRYALEFFLPLYSAKAARPFMKTLERLQDCLGHLNDIAVALSLLLTLPHPPENEDHHHHAGNIPFTAGFLVGWQQAVAQDILTEAARHWVSFTKASPFWIKK